MTLTCGFSPDQSYSRFGWLFHSLGKIIFSRNKYYIVDVYVFLDSNRRKIISNYCILMKLNLITWLGSEYPFPNTTLLNNLPLNILQSTDDPAWINYYTGDYKITKWWFFCLSFPHLLHSFCEKNKLFPPPSPTSSLNDLLFWLTQ